ncbi:tRNA modification GTPase MnmE [Ceratocystis fimbriata CBS 114723]|uniref:tRNA modification GTPase MnmE n=1 Tax=Ceratocystis fimbriata CBS 114723 TaxID=1035309 RepID=A0A2C5X3M8_9PEZI|nr:tRNA modification GTPase MnmE [Ceratocystis fimbriata CBS 114723]
MKPFLALCQAYPSRCLRRTPLIRDRLAFPQSALRYPVVLSRRWNSGLFANTDDTIFALSTAQGPAGIAVIRVSGPAALDIYKSLCPSKPLPRPRNATVRTLFDPRSSTKSEVLDSSALVLYFPAPETVTGEDVVELHVHGGTATVKAILSAVPQCGPSSSVSQPFSRRIRYAEPGEFTKRAFMNGRLDLAQVEALSNTLSAETEQQRRAAVRGAGGELGRQYEKWRQNLLNARAELEALIDFSEDQHFDESPAELLGNVAKYVHHLLASIEQYKRAGERSELVRNGIRIAFVGPPNAGKSSLMNLIVGREASIVSSEAGTTRDIVEANLDIRGYLCSFADTAGFRTTHEIDGKAIGAIEMEGIRRARQKAEDSDLVVVLASVEASRDTSSGLKFAIRYDAETLKLAAAAKDRILIVNKIDTISPDLYQSLLSQFISEISSIVPELQGLDVMSISCAQREVVSGLASAKYPDYIQALTDKLVSLFTNMTSIPADMQSLFGVTSRQCQLLEECTNHLQNFLQIAQPQADTEAEADIVIAAEHLRFAASCLARITGRGDVPDVEDVLGVIFEK